VATKKAISKSKTTKAAKSTKRTVAAKVTKPVAKASNRFSLVRINILAAVTFLVLAVLAAVLMNSASYEITSTYLTADKLAGGVIMPAYRHFIDVEYRWLLVAILVLSAVPAVLHATLWKQKYASAVKSKVMTWNWVEQGVLQALLGVVVVTLLGFQDMTTIKLFAVMLFAISLLGWYAEKEFLVSKAAALKTHLFGALTGLVLVVFLVMPLLFTYMYGQVRAPWYVYAVTAAFVLTLGLNRFNQYNYLRGHKSWKSYEVVERNHLVIGLLSKLAIAVVLIVGLAK
jgi:hypothetical protein